jgi:hypothetical protein
MNIIIVRANVRALDNPNIESVARIQCGAFAAICIGIGKEVGSRLSTGRIGRGSQVTFADATIGRANIAAKNTKATICDVSCQYITLSRFENSRIADKQINHRTSLRSVDDATVKLNLAQ